MAIALSSGTHVRRTLLNLPAPVPAEGRPLCPDQYHSISSGAQPHIRASLLSHKHTHKHTDTHTHYYKTNPPRLNLSLSLSVSVYLCLSPSLFLSLSLSLSL